MSKMTHFIAVRNCHSAIAGMVCGCLSSSVVNTPNFHFLSRLLPIMIWNRLTSFLENAASLPAMSGCSRGWMAPFLSHPLSLNRRLLCYTLFLTDTRTIMIINDSISVNAVHVRSLIFYPTAVSKWLFTDSALRAAVNNIWVLLTLLGGRERDCAACQGKGSASRRGSWSGWSARAGRLWPSGTLRTGEALWDPLGRECLHYWIQHLHSAATSNKQQAAEMTYYSKFFLLAEGEVLYRWAYISVQWKSRTSS